MQVMFFQIMVNQLLLNNGDQVVDDVVYYQVRWELQEEYCEDDWYKGYDFLLYWVGYGGW